MSDQLFHDAEMHNEVDRLRSEVARLTAENARLAADRERLDKIEAAMRANNGTPLSDFLTAVHGAVWMRGDGIREAIAEAEAEQAIDAARAGGDK